MIDPDDDEALRDRLAGHLRDESGPSVRSQAAARLIAAAWHTVHEAMAAADAKDEPVAWRDLPESEKDRLVLVVSRLLLLRVIREADDLTDTRQEADDDGVVS